MNIPEKHRAVAHAWVDGAEIQILASWGWAAIPCPEWDINSEYRLKPKAKVKKWRWVYQQPDGYLEITRLPMSDFEAETTVSKNKMLQKIDATMIEVDE